MSDNQLGLLARRLESVAGLPDRAAEALLALRFQLRTLSAGQPLYAPGATDLPCCVLLKGSVVRYKMRDDGSRAIVAFELPGDIINLETHLLRQTDCGAAAATEIVIAFLPHALLAQTRRAEPGLEVALWRYAFVKSAALEEWLLNIGKRSPIGRIAHLLMELRSRLMATGNADIDADAIHVTVQDVADAMGLQAVVATRILHDLASQGVVRRSGEVILIQDAKRLAKIGEFRPDYLHIAVPAS